MTQALLLALIEAVLESLAAVGHTGPAAARLAVLAAYVRKGGQNALRRDDEPGECPCSPTPVQTHSRGREERARSIPQPGGTVADWIATPAQPPTTDAKWVPPAGDKCLVCGDEDDDGCACGKGVKP